MRQRTVIWITEPIKTLRGTIYDFDHKSTNFRRAPAVRGVSQVRKRMTREGERCERVAWPKLFGAAGRESARAIRSAKVVDPPPRFGSGGTGDLDTNRGPPIPTPNAKKPTRVHACVCVRRELSLSRAFSLRYKKTMTTYILREMISDGIFAIFTETNERNENFDRKIDD